MKSRGMILLVVGVLGAVLVCTYDMIAGKPVNDITGPKSISALIIFGIFIIVGVSSLVRRPKKDTGIKKNPQ